MSLNIIRMPVELIKLLAILVILIIVFFCSFLVGRYSVPFDMVLAIIFSKVSHIPQYWTDEMETVVLNVRMPRIMAAMLIGAALSASGAAYQGMFRNPMVSPGILGVSAGASFGAALSILFSFDIIGVQIMAFACGLLAVMVTYLISTRINKKGDIMLVMVLAGIIVGTLFTSFVSIIKYVADPYSKLPAITFWLMGSLASVTAEDVYIACIPIVVGLIPLTLLRWKLNVMSFGDEEARTLGIDTKKLRVIVIICATLMTASAVSVSGIIGLVGLIVPHLARLLVGPNYQILLPTSIVIGSLYLLVVDGLARTIYSVEIPIGILTSIIGAPFFMYLLLNTRRGWA